MGLDSCHTPSLSWLTYNPKDREDILPYAEAFEQIRSKIGQDFSLRKIGEGTWGNVFEIHQDKKWSYVLKLPRPFYLQDKDFSIIEKVKHEINLQKKFILRHEQLIKKYHKEYFTFVTEDTDSDLYQNFSGSYSCLQKWSGLSFEEINKKRVLLQKIKIPRLLEVYQGTMPIIIMDKIPGKTLWFEIIRSVFSPLFNQKYAFWSKNESLFKPSNKTLYQNCIDSDLNDKDIAFYIRYFEYFLTKEFGKKQAQKFLINPWMLEDDPNLTASDFIMEVDQVSKPPKDIFLQMYNEWGQELQDIYDLFVDEFWIEHPDPNLYNFIITPDGKLWIIDFW